MFRHKMVSPGVFWVQGIKEKKDIDSVLQRIDKAYGNKNSNCKVLAMGEILHLTKPTSYYPDGPNELLRQSDKHSLLHPVEYCVEIYRKHCSKNPPFCNSIYGLTDQLISLQLVMAKKNKENSGCFEADSHDVITTHQNLIQSKLGGSSTNNFEILEIEEDYNQFLAHCNAVDYADIINSVRQCFQSSDEDTSILALYQNQRYIILGFPQTVIEIEILLLLLGGRDVMLFSPSQGNSTMTNEKFEKTVYNPNNTQNHEVPGTQESFKPSTPVHLKRNKTDSQVTPQQHGRQVPMSLSGGQSPILSQSQFSRGRSTMGHELSVLMSYLQLLVNSRDELALARVIDTPDRELGVRKFTKIKILAREKNMSMYQMVTSFILQIRLGGKSYAPTSDNPLWPMTKGLSEFVSFFQKLQNILEEVSDAKSAVTKILGNLQAAFNKTTDGSIARDDIRKAITHLKNQIDYILNNDEQNGLKQGQKPIMVGSESYLLLRKLLDKNVLYDYQEKELSSSLKTPCRKMGTTCSLLTKFRTPDGPTPEKVENEGRNQTSKNQHAKHQLRQESLYGNMSWANPAVNIEIRKLVWATHEENTLNLEQSRKSCGVFNSNETPRSSSKKRTFADTCASFKEKTCSPQRKRPFESKDDQENTISNQGGFLVKPTVRRGLLSHQSKEVGKKKAPSKKKQNSRKLVQGQKQVTHFFR